MGHVLKRMGTGLWVVMAAMGVAAVALVGLLKAEASNPPGQDLLDGIRGVPSASCA